MIDPPLPVIVTAHSCLLIPAAFIAWWYWTKRTTRRVVRGFLTLARGKAPSSVDATALGMSEDSVYSTPFEPAAASPSSATTDECQDAYYGLSEDSSSESSSTFRFIRWLKGTKGSRVRHKVRTATKKNLRGSPNPSESDTAEHTQNFGNSRPVHCTTYEGIVAVELCSLEEPSTPRAPFTGPETTVRITIETSPFGEFVEIPYAIASQYLERSSY